MAQRRAFYEIRQRFERKLALDDGRGIRLRQKGHGIRRLRSDDGAVSIRSRARKDEVVAHRFDLDAVRDPVQVADDLLEVRRGQIDDGRVLHIRNN